MLGVSHISIFVDAGVWGREVGEGGYHKWRFEIQKNYRILNLVNCHELSMNYV